MKFNSLSIAVAGGCLLSLSACQNKDLVAKLDADNDDKVSRAEFRQVVQEEAFDLLDANKDGAVTLEEWKAVEDVRQPLRRFNSLDSNGDSKLSFDEFAKTSRKRSTLDNMFGTLDRNEDGFLTDQDFTD
tara:strand:+ start:4857 stop:5246 length:390 start_codon:yes stop_codon:yes gene_type:complete